MQDENVTVLLQGAPASGKSQLLYWRIRGVPKPSYNETIEDEFTISERMCGQPVSVKFLDTGGHPEFAEMLPEWVSRTNAQMIVINLEDAQSLEYVLAHAKVFSSSTPLWGAVVVGNLPTGEANRKVSTEAGRAFAASLKWAKFAYVETNTRSGNVELAFTTLMECIGNSLSPFGAERVAITGELKSAPPQPGPKPPHKPELVLDDTVTSWIRSLALSPEACEVLSELSWEELEAMFVSEVVVVKTELAEYGVTRAVDRNKVIAAWNRRKAQTKSSESERVTRLEAKLAAQERLFTGRLEALELQLSEATQTRRMQEMFLKHLREVGTGKGPTSDAEHSTPIAPKQVRVKARGAGLFGSRSNSPESQ